MTLECIYNGGKGHITVNLEQLESQSISKIRKLLIFMSDNGCSMEEAKSFYGQRFVEEHNLCKDYADKHCETQEKLHKWECKIPFGEEQEKRRIEEIKSWKRKSQYNQSSFKKHKSVQDKIGKIISTLTIL